ncbi:MAG: hypothetical protein KDA93_10810 [Planctomycetaceae bacterium]|nr:hypothetical protein [Planctomycetaceae bacterium]
MNRIHVDDNVLKPEMTMRIPRHRRIVIGQVTSALLVLAFSNAAVFADPTIHLVIVADTLDRSIGQSVQVDVEKVEEAFKGNVPERQLQIHKLTDEKAGRQNWLDQMGRIHPEADDALVVYYSGHGAYERQNGHLFAPRGEMLPRKDVVDAIRKQGGRLGVLIGDCCSTEIEVPVPVPFLPPVDEVTPLFDELFIKPSGFVDVSATKPGEEAMGTAAGGVFTIAFHLFCIEHSQERKTWNELLTGINQTTRQMSPKQTAYAVSPLPKGHGGPAPGGIPSGGKQIRLGVQGVDNAQGRRHGGVAIARVYANMPSTRLRLPGDSNVYRIVPGRDVITHVNGNSVRTNAELMTAVRSSPSPIRLTIYDDQTKTTADYLADVE